MGLCDLVDTADVLRSTVGVWFVHEHSLPRHFTTHRGQNRRFPAYLPYLERFVASGAIWGRFSSYLGLFGLILAYFGAIWRYGCLWGVDPTPQLYGIDWLTMGGSFRGVYAPPERALYRPFFSARIADTSTAINAHGLGYLWAYRRGPLGHRGASVGTTTVTVDG